MRPDFEIRADGTDVTAAIADRLVSLHVSDEAGWTADECILRLDDRDGTIAIPRRGATLSVSLGYVETGLTWLGDFVVEGVAGTGPLQEMTVTAKSADLTGAIRAPRTEGWTDVTLGAIVAAIAGRHGLQAAVAQDLAGHHYDHVAQTAESDLNLLTRLARDLGAVAKVAAGRLALAPEGEAVSTSGQPLPPVPLARGAFQSWRWRLGERRHRQARGAAARPAVAVGRTGPRELRRLGRGAGSDHRASPRHRRSLDRQAGAAPARPVAGHRVRRRSARHRRPGRARGGRLMPDWSMRIRLSREGTGTVPDKPITTEIGGVALQLTLPGTNPQPLLLLSRELNEHPLLISEN